MSPKNVLYLSYTGILEPLGKSQVGEYLRALGETGKYRFHLISFEKEEDLADRDRVKELTLWLEESGIDWEPLQYHKKPPILSTLWDIFWGYRLAEESVKTKQIDLIHARSYVPAAIALRLKRKYHVPFLFDMRGFWADEKVDSGAWPRSSPVYKQVKRMEKDFLLEADSVVSLTRSGVKEMKTFDYLRDRDQKFRVISTCTNLDLFTPSVSHPDAVTVGMVGSVRNWYDLDPAIKVFKTISAKKPGARLLIINRNEHAYIRERLAAHDIPENSFELKSVHHQGVVDEIRKMSLAVFFIKNFYSKKASAPTKLGEFMACGVPVITNGEIGDIQTLTEGKNVAVLVDPNDQRSLERGAEEILELSQNPEASERCRKLAESEFSLEGGVRTYEEIYADLLVTS